MPLLRWTFAMGMPDRRSQRLSRWGSVLAPAAALGMLLWLGCSGTGTRAEMRLASERAVRVAELRGTFAYYDEWRTMSARMAVQSGDPQWVARFEEAGPKLAAAIKEAVALATPEVGSALGKTVEEANGDLSAMERAAFALLAAGDRDGAQALLNGPEFDYLQSVYASGIEAFGQDLETLATTRAKALNDRAWMETSGLGLSALFLVAAVFALKGRARLRAALAATETVARTDALTGLPNRRGLYEQLQTALARADRSGGAVALLLCAATAPAPAAPSPGWAETSSRSWSRLRLRTPPVRPARRRRSSRGGSSPCWDSRSRSLTGLWRRSAPASASRSRGRRTGAPTRWCAAPTLRCIGPRPTGAAASTSSTPALTPTSRHARCWKASCARPWPTTSCVRTSSRWSIWRPGA